MRWLLDRVRQVDWSDDRSDGSWTLSVVAVGGALAIGADLLLIAMRLP